MVFLLIFYLGFAYSYPNSTMKIILDEGTSNYYSLPSLFSGSNLTYSYNCSASNKSVVNLNQIVVDHNIKTLNFDQNLGAVPNESIQMTTRWYEDYGLAFYFTDTTIVCIKVDTLQISLEVYWFHTFSNLTNDQKIIGVEQLNIGNEKSLIFSVIQSKLENIAEFFIINYTDTKNLSVVPVFLEEVKSLNELKIHKNFRSHFLAFSGMSGNTSKMVLADFSNFKKPICNTVTNIYSATGVESIPINPISILILSNSTNTGMIVLDEQNYIVSYYIENSKPIEKSSLNLKIYDKAKYIYPYNYEGEDSSSFFIYTAKGILITDLESVSELKFINTSDVTSVLGLFESNKY